MALEGVSPPLPLMHERAAERGFHKQSSAACFPKMTSDVCGYRKVDTSKCSFSVPAQKGLQAIYLALSRFPVTIAFSVYTSHPLRHNDQL